MRMNQAQTATQHRTHEGAPARRINAFQQLQRSVLSCLLWESEFYEDGVEIATRIRDLVHECDPIEVSALAVTCRSEYQLRHVPLLLARELCRHPAKPETLVADTIEAVIQRADELSEFVAIYWLDGRQPLSAQAKKGLARAFRKFSAYQLAKYNRDYAVKLRDVLFLVNAKPKDDKQAETWKLLVDGELPAPDTWEVALSAGKDKHKTFERLISGKKLGYMALLRNLRNMESAGVDPGLVERALIDGAPKSRALPFRFIAAASAAPRFEPTLDKAMQLASEGLPRLRGETIVLVDVSGSMSIPLSYRSDLSRMSAACALAILVNGIAERCRVFSFSYRTKEVPARHGMALADAIQRSQPNGGTYLGAAIDHVNVLPHDRLIVMTDEQSHDAVPGPSGRGYMINVASNRNGVGYGAWNHVDGFSEAVVRWIQALESEQAS